MFRGRLDGAGQPVAVKVLRPGIAQRFRTDLESFDFAARLAERHSEEARRLRLIEAADTLARSVALEMDLRLEAAALSEMAENTREDAGTSQWIKANTRTCPKCENNIEKNGGCK